MPTRQLCQREKGKCFAPFIITIFIGKRRAGVEVEVGNVEEEGMMIVQVYRWHNLLEMVPRVRLGKDKMEAGHMMLMTKPMRDRGGREGRGR